MGVVYLARTEGAEGFARPVVVKSILPHLLERSELAEMFVREARILSNLDHPGIVRILDFGREQRRYLMVLQYVDGYDLGRWRRYLTKTGRKVPVNLAVYIICQVLDALDYAHGLKREEAQLKAIHRDISPSNILLTADAQVRLLDFGIARVISDADEGSRWTGFKGKLVYAAPELLEGGEPSAQSDIYSTALVLYQLLAGKNPFHAATDTEIIRLILRQQLTPVHEVRPEAPSELEQALHTALHKQPDQRFSSAGQFAAALRQTQTLSDDQLRSLLAERLQADFHGALPRVMGIETLEHRDRSWRSSTDEPTIASSAPPQRLSSSAPTRAVSGGQLGELKLPVLSTKQRKRRKQWTLAAAPLTAVLTAAAWLAWPNDDTADAQAELLALPSSLGAASVAAQPPTSATTTQAPASATSQADTPIAKRQAITLANKIAEHSELIATCYDKATPNVVPRVSVKLGFRVLRDGSVESVTLTPADLARTDFGQCVASGYQHIHFGQQKQRLKFHVPVDLDQVLKFHGR